MKKPWKQTIRRASGLVENICRHNVGHGAAGSVDWLRLNKMDGYGIHGCDGCCSTPEWKIADLQEGVRIANRIIFDFRKQLVEFKAISEALLERCCSLVVLAKEYGADEGSTLKHEHREVMKLMKRLNRARTRRVLKGSKHV